MPILMRANNARAHINFLIESKQDFVLSSSNYTTGIDSPSWKAKYVATMQTNRTFACFAKLKKAVKEKPVPDVTNDQVRYFQHNFKRDLFVDRVYNIDLKSAYATILFNDGYLDEETYKYICQSKKQERLASVGMLASRKEVFTFKKGNPTDEQEIVSPMSGFFFHAAKRTFEIMDDLKWIVAEDYLYTWVDGIYFTPNDIAAKKCQEYLTAYGFNYSFDRLDNFDVHIRPDMVVVKFVKGDKKKIFNLPSLNNEFKRVVIDSILSLNKNKANEKGTRKIPGRYGR